MENKHVTERGGGEKAIQCPAALDMLKTGVICCLPDDDLTFCWGNSSFFRRAGYPRDGFCGRFHDLRHSYAVAAIRSGDDIKTVQGNLGHATAAFTLDVYGHVTDQMKKESAARMDSYIKDVLGL